MKFWDIARRAARSLRQAKARTLLTSLAIAVGAFTLTMSLAAGQGSREYADKLINSNIDPKSLFIVKDKSLFGQGTQSSGLNTYDPDSTMTRSGIAVKQLTQTDLDKLRARKDLTNVQPTYQIQARYVSFEGDAKKYTTDITMYNPGVRSETAAGSLPDLGADIDATSAVIPEAFAETLGKRPDELIGKKITVKVAKPAQAPTEKQVATIVATEGPEGLTKLANGETKDVVLTISAVAKKSATALATGTSVQVSSSAARDLAEYTTEGTANFQKYIGVTATAANGYKPEDVKASLADAGYPAQTAKDLQNLLFTIVNILQGIVIGFGILALIASVFGIINTQYISVLERTQQIGLMKALGMRRRDVARLFRYEAAWIGFFGGVLGAGVAWIAGTLLNPIITKALSLGDGNYLLIFEWLPTVLLIIGLMLIAVIAGYFPSRKAAKLDPIEALRTE